jgi:hypothetical protein
VAEGAWVPAFDSIWSSQKTARVAKELRTSSDVAGAKFLRLMSWMRDHRPNGELGTADRATWARAIGLANDTTRDSDAAERGNRFYRALVEAAFVTSDERGFVRGWADGPGRIVSRRETDRLRKAHPNHPDSSPNAYTLATHPGQILIKGCPKCDLITSPAKPIATAVPDRPSTGTTSQFPRNETPVPQEFQRTGRTGSREQGAPTPLAPPEMDTTRTQADLLVATSPEPWATVITKLREHGMNSGTIVGILGGTRLESTDGNGAWAVRAPNAFARDFIESKYVPQIREAMREASIVVTSLVVLTEGGPREPDVVEPT